MREPRYLGKHVLPDLGEPRFQRQYTAIRDRLRPRASRTWVLPTFATAAVLTIVVAGMSLVSARQAAPRLFETAVLDSDEAGATGMHLPGGSSFTLDRGSKATLSAAKPELLEVRLEQGRVSVNVVDPQHRVITVAAGATVVGARGRGPHLCFVVSLAPDGGDVAVTVSKGAIDVVLPDGAVRSIGEGETWSSARAPAVPSASAIATTPMSSADFELDAAPSPLKHASSPRRIPSAKGLLEDAEQALADGRPKDAARLFDTLRRRYRGDARAGLAAFELGRIRLDHFRDALGAEEAFRDALTLSPPLSIREDAEARRVQALDRMGAHDRCILARDAYLTRFPSGIHNGVVGASCVGP